jgi:hypothetical protein
LTALLAANARAIFAWLAHGASALTHGFWNLEHGFWNLESIVAQESIQSEERFKKMSKTSRKDQALGQDLSKHQL